MPKKNKKKQPTRNAQEAVAGNVTKAFSGRRGKLGDVTAPEDALKLGILLGALAGQGSNARLAQPDVAEGPFTNDAIFNIVAELLNKQGR